MAVEQGAEVGQERYGEGLKNVFESVMELPGQKMLECFWLEFFINANVLGKHNLKQDE